MQRDQEALRRELCRELEHIGLDSSEAAALAQLQTDSMAGADLQVVYDLGAEVASWLYQLDCEEAECRPVKRSSRRCLFP